VSRARDAQGLGIAPGRFAEHLEVLRRDFEPRPLRGLAGAGRRFRRPAVALCFDDGYADNLHEARPLLERLDVPATVFVTTGALGGRELWWDALERLVCHERALPRELPEAIPGAREVPEPAASGADAEARRALFGRLHAALRAQDEPARSAALAALASWSGTPPDARVAHPTLTPDELVALADGVLVEAAAHSVSHPVLAGLSRERQRAEIAGGKARLEEVLARPVEAFAYPYGDAGSFTEETVALVREAGFARAYTTERAPADRAGDRLRIPRCAVGDWDGEKLARRLARWSRR
jgi:peptidoglycan/xylan/chitin deacetylase (PgdA/CDA1 family)